MAQASPQVSYIAKDGLEILDSSTYLCQNPREYFCRNRENYSKMKDGGRGEAAQQLTVLVALQEDPGSIPVPTWWPFQGI